MFKNIAKLIIVSLLSISLIAPNVLAFHENGESLIQIDSKVDLKKNEIQSKYCTTLVEENKIPEGNEKTEVSKKDKSKNSIVKKSEKERLEELAKAEKEKPLKLKDIFNVKSYHSEEIKDAPKTLDISILKNMGKIGPQTSIETLLSYYCIQAINENDIKNFQINKSIKDLYNKIAKINGHIHQDGKGDRNFSIDGTIFKRGKIKLDVDENLIFAKAQFIIIEEERLQKKAEEEAATAATIAAEKKNNEAWINENKQPFLEKIRDKQKKYIDEIKDLKQSINNLDLLVKKHKDLFKLAKEKIKILQTFDNHTQEIKSLKKEIIINESQYLKDTDVEKFQNDYLVLSKINFEKKYDNYQIVNTLLDEAEQSEDKKHFQGYKPLIGKNKIGFIKEFEAITTRDLGSKREKDDINNLRKSIELNIFDINFNIIDTFEEIQKLDNEYANKFPLKEIIIGLIIFLFIVAFIIYHFYSRKKLSEARNDAEERISNLKRDFDGKLRNTSDQIKSFGRVTRSQQSTQTSDPEPIQVSPKTSQEITSSKFNELLSEYNDALEDFTKVVVFKEKWNGLALSRKERQDGSKTILINSTRAFEKAEIWCVTFDENYFAFPGSSVKSNMATYMNLDFEKASRDFKGVYAISTGSGYSAEPAKLRSVGAGFVVDEVGKISFPN